MSLMDMFRPKWKHSDWHVRAAAVKTIGQESVLAQMLEADPSPEVREAAAAQITDIHGKIDAGLNRLAVADWSRGETAECHFAGMAFSGQGYVRAAAIQRMTDRGLLERVAANANEQAVCLAARQRLDDPSVGRRDYRALEPSAPEYFSVALHRAMLECLIEGSARPAAPCSAPSRSTAAERSQRTEERQPAPASPAQAPGIVHGGFGEPYCSRACYDEGGRYAAAVMMKNQTGVCGICQRPVQVSMHGATNCAVVPYEGVNLFVCDHCTSQGKAHLQTYAKCCMCQKPLASRA